MNTRTTCAVCETECDMHRPADAFWVWTINCPWCGTYEIDETASDSLHKQPDWWPRISGWLRDHSLGGGTIPKLTGDIVQLEPDLPNPDTQEQLDRLLLLISSKTTVLGETIRLDMSEAAATCCRRDIREVEMLTQHLRDLQLLDPRTGGEATPEAVKLAVNGMLRADSIRRRVGDGTQVFVAMQFTGPDDEDHALLTAAYDAGIAPAIRSAKLAPFRVDRAPPDHQRIDARIIVEIQKSRALHADLTGMRPSVLYEAGLAQGRGLPVTWSVHKRDLEQLPFDTRQLFHVVWESPDELREKLHPLIEMRVGHGKLRRK